MTEEPLLSVRDLEKHYPIRKGLLNRQVGAARAVDGISFDIAPGETLGLVGESGCGKSTAATSIVRLEDPTGGEVIFNGGGRAGAARNADGTHPNDVTRFDDRELKAFRRDAQMIFQDPSSSFDPRMSVGSAVAEMLQIHGMSDRHQRRAIVEDLLERVGLSPEDYDRYPHEFSGGQKQRIALARALVLNPELIVADEPVSALDVSIQAEILSLISDLQDEFDLSLLFISHDMSVIREICDRVAVMYLGEIVEIGPTDRIFADPQHPYTEALLSAIPTPDPRSTAEGIELTGTVPSPTDPPSGCRFHTRCHKVIQPDGVDLDQSNWRGLLNLRDALAAGSVDVDQIRENFRTGSDADATPEAVKGQIRREFDVAEAVSAAEIEALLDEALDKALGGDLEGAAATLSERVTTPCEETVPERTSHAADHESACLRHERERSAPPNPADD
ncbi:oligopeptide/dipeptide ABC transporter ATP-binding protein [Halorubrum sp. CBA1229]|uniref:ABC transporter ATP-binding protein n=1 Tax=Halorubrum sp. CBA1229 TaxID=1853699 RepID=UPI000F3CA128|nr:oligopeptide/dipeptide ABC transporter ATP-binding protein [Halorubrum sp. CBA1229]QKY15981.1 ATP-binding cassette domain-containing protein [Halorubrum sp. CBA1229]